MTHAALALAPTFGEGIAVVACAFILFVGSVYVLLTAVLGLRMGYLVLAVSLFGWMLLLSVLWTFGAPGTPNNLGPRGTEKHWQVFQAATTDRVKTKYPETLSYPDGRWQSINGATAPSKDTVTSVMQAYLAQQAAAQLDKAGTQVCTATSAPTAKCMTFDPTNFVVQDMKFVTSSNGTHLVAAHAFYTLGGPVITVYAYRDQGNVPVYSYSFLGASLLGFLLHLPFLDKAERRRREILTGGTAPPWYGPA
jgi:hypothetical protein